MLHIHVRISFRSEGAEAQRGSVAVEHCVSVSRRRSGDDTLAVIDVAIYAKMVTERVVMNQECGLKARRRRREAIRVAFRGGEATKTLARLAA